jgi:hypothetical protein
MIIFLINDLVESFKYNVKSEEKIEHKQTLIFELLT